MGLLTNLVLLAAAAAGVTADTADVAAPAVPSITSITYSGTGCTSDPKLTGGFNDATLSFSAFNTNLPGATTQTANCQVHLEAKGASPGWQVALQTTRVRGHAVLAPGTTLNHYTTVYFSENAGNTDTIQTSFSNSGDGTVDQLVSLAGSAGTDKVWSSCTGSDGFTGILNINFRSALVGDGTASFKTNTEEWDLVWRRC
ncbi:hypothetical protein B0J18DRAFT_434069 [Chaetomium sp. MPI-SDFR-AT-0129]|nr:hypothetical protein B0J18DRAFT_434069 [Chaetomium sp. MPI-SDFR-AT-0129]